MKKGLIFVLFALVSIVSYSQISWNAKVGMNMSNFTGDMDTDMRIGFNVGVGMEYQFSDMWSIQPSLMFTQKGAKQDEVKMNPMYLEIPVLAAARFAIADNQNIVVKAGLILHLVLLVSVKLVMKKLISLVTVMINLEQKDLMQVSV